MHAWLDAGTIGSLIPIVAMLIPIVAIIGGVVQWWHSEALRHETIRTLAQSGQAIPPELLRRGRDHDHDPSDSVRQIGRRPSTFRGGVILSSLGLGIGAALYIMFPGDWFWTSGIIVFCLGAALLIIWKQESRSAA